MADERFPPSVRFWRQVEDDTTAGELVVVAFTTWKRIAERHGHRPGEVATQLFRAACEPVMQLADFDARVGWLEYAGFWRHTSNARDRVAEALAEVMPIEKWAAEREIDSPIECRVTAVRRIAGEPGSHLYDHVQRARRELWMEIPEDTRFFGSPDPWVRAVGRHRFVVALYGPRDQGALDALERHLRDAGLHIVDRPAPSTDDELGWGVRPYGKFVITDSDGDPPRSREVAIAIQAARDDLTETYGSAGLMADQIVYGALAFPNSS